MNINKYNQIYQVLSGEIIEGVYQNQENLPSEHALVERFSVSRETVRKALNMLRENGFIQKVKGKGSVVIYDHTMDFTVSHLTSFKEIQEMKSIRYETNVVELAVYDAEDVPKVQKALGLYPKDKIWKLVRQRIHDSKTHIIDTDFFLHELMPGLNEEVAKQSTYQYIEERLGLSIAYAYKEITFEPMTAAELDLFGPVTPQYAATVKSVVYLNEAKPFQYNVSKHLASEFKFTDFSRRFTGE
ncbi:trehalose operon repressor [Corticicoccus populi]|uniref:Trehalose operon repressor n=1 Tax=Corticicoccus populi TaxID=1812821 RepID=A0ABW5WWT6_9STAP